TRSGTFLRASWIGYRADLGSDFSMTELEAELRGFIPLGQDWVLGGQALVESRRGDVPFFRQTRIGAPNRLRGTFSGRFRDEAGWLTQGEIRTPVFWWRLAAVGFLGFGAVAESVGEFGSAEGIVAGGAGLRIAVSDRGANIRMDYGFASDRERAFYVSLGEAF
ncbi:MAG: BamA/TamA family outer membrane protein, partial [Myxococcota bacterium]